MPMMICQQRGREYYAKRWNQKYCSRECKDETFSNARRRVSETAKGTLCWKCKKTNAKDCPWFSKREEPVPGWVATKTIVRGKNHGNGTVVKLFKSYMVHECPLFEEERRETKWR